jgi:hypothetical protein
VSNAEHYAPEDDVPDDWRPADTGRWSRVELLAEIDALNECVAKWVGIAKERKGAVEAAERWRRVVVAAYSLVAHDEGRNPDEIVQELLEDLHDALGGQ